MKQQVGLISITPPFAMICHNNQKEKIPWPLNYALQIANILSPRFYSIEQVKSIQWKGSFNDLIQMVSLNSFLLHIWTKDFLVFPSITIS